MGSLNRRSFIKSTATAAGRAAVPGGGKLTRSAEEDPLGVRSDFAVAGNKTYLKPIPRALAYLRRSLLSDGRLARYYELKTNKPLYLTGLRCVSIRNSLNFCICELNTALLMYRLFIVNFGCPTSGSPE